MLDLSKSYEENVFKSYLIKFLPDDFVYNKIDIKIKEDHKYFKSAQQLGTVESLDDLVIIQVERLRAEKSRTSITKELFKFLENIGYSKALIITFSKSEAHYRLSYIKSDLNWISETKVKRKFTNPKRLSFLLGENQRIHTATKQLVRLGKIKSLEDLNSRFNIEIINKEFFNNYIDLFNQLSSYLNKDREFKLFAQLNKIDIEVFAKKLIGQIVFCYFLQKKGWLGAKIDKEIYEGDLNFIRNQFNSYSKKEKKNFFNDFLEPLFYKGLNRKNKNDFCKDLNCKIPYLNGGLFQEIENYSWKDSFLNIPNSLFSNKDENGILDIFDLYNFTVDESSDFDVEIAVDPEMLGYIFENLLPENIKKKHGAHYTPKEIVEYICKKSVSEYLRINLSEKFYNDVDTLIDYARFPDETIRLAENNIKDIKFDKNFLLEVDLLIKNIKICDPAVGSGAFIIGALNFIVNIKKITFYFSKKRTLADLYELKRNLIENNIFGIDKDYGAIETCKLRLWLSLTIDEENTVKPLPNLDFRIIQGNSLIEEFEGINLDINVEKGSQLELISENNSKSEDIQNLYNLQKTFFNETDLETKQKIIKKINKSYFSIIKNEIENKISLTLEKKQKLLKSLDNFKSVNSENNYMPWQLRFFDVFLEKNGFDIIIANPPYNREKDFAEMFEPVNNSLFGKKYHAGKMNFWYYFLHKAIDKSNTNAVISFITSRYWITSTGSRSLIKRIRDTLSFVDILDIGKVKVFDKVIGQHIVCTYSKKKIPKFNYKKISNNISDIFSSKNTQNIKISSFSQNEVFTENNEINFRKSIIRYNKNDYDLLNNGSKLSLFNTTQGVIESPDKISKQNLKNKPSRTINIGDGVFVVNEDEISKINPNKEEKRLFKRYLNSSNVKKYQINFNNEYLIYSDKEISKKIKNKHYPNIQNHLNKYKKYITSGNGPYGLHRPRNENFFLNPKIIFKNMFLEPAFTYDEEKFYVGISFIVIIQNSSLSLKYLLALLNSKYGFYWFIKNAKERGIAFDVTIEKINNFPIPKIKEENKSSVNKIIKNVETLISSKNKKQSLIDEIDKLIFEICNLDENQVHEIEETISSFLSYYNKI